MMVFERSPTDPHAARWLEQLEAAMMAATFAASSDLPEERRKALIRLWAQGTFNAASHGLDVRQGCGAGLLVWQDAEGERSDLIYRAVTGFACSLGRVYRQPDGTWASMIIAGVRDSQCEAQAAAEWAISRLTAE